MPLANEGSPTLLITNLDGRTHEHLFAFAYRPNIGRDRRLRIFTEEEGRLTYFPYITTVGRTQLAEQAEQALARPQLLPVAEISFALRFDRWLQPAYKRGEFQPGSSHEFGRRAFDVITENEIIILADCTLHQKPRRYGHWGDVGPTY